ncbi:MAG: UDP-N-acetylglucosamine--N-acetylmuramyl-(pentapeptide) pyrophosphoryl-undecaprenol [Paenibacillaceae bacterium]|nr:UDP-N-acetylglucosamine--N-acetylmuramyl-(pentapeptide) pyrophosphoryl-undecaprenol [Paenibacillaceae bacterium]
MGQRIVFTGGGSTGHVAVNLALIPYFVQEGWKVAYIGSENGIEKQLIAEQKQVDYYGIATGKLRRYLDWNNVKDPFKVIKGIFQAYRIIRRLRPSVVFSKGGFVSVPVVLGAWMNRVPVVIHESDFTPGLANRLSIPFASKVCATFPETVQLIASGKAEYIGAVVRDQLRSGVAAKGLALCNFVRNKPVLLVMGGSQGSQRLNALIRGNLSELLRDFQIVHICGKGQTDPSIQLRGYRQFDYVDRELPDLMAMSNLVVSRAGSNAIFEFLALRLPMLLIPLSRKASRGDQIHNARSFVAAGYAEMMEEEQLTDDSFLKALNDLLANKERYIGHMDQGDPGDAKSRLIEIITGAAGSSGPAGK